MDENQIAEELKKKVPETTAPIQGYPEDEQGGDPNEHTNIPLENYVLKHEVAEFLSLPRGYTNNPETVNQLEAVVAWAHDIAGTTEPNEILRVLARKQGEMGIRSKPDKLFRIYQYAKISRQIDNMFERQRQLYG